MAEVRRTLQRQFGIPPDRIERLESKLREHFGDAWIEGFEHLIPELTNDEKDRHVLAAAAHANLPLVVTYNLRHFPSDATLPWGVRAVGPSGFLKELYGADADSVLKVLREQSEEIGRTFADQLRVLHKAVPAFIDVVSRDTKTAL